MATVMSVWEDSYKPGADLAGKQYYAVAFSALDTVVVAAAATTRCCGVLQEEPRTGDWAKFGAGQAFRVMHMGRTPVVTDGSGTAIAVGDMIGPAIGGKFVKKATDNDNVMGMALGASSADGTIIDMLLGVGVGGFLVYDA